VPKPFCSGDLFDLHAACPTRRRYRRCARPLPFYGRACRRPGHALPPRLGRRV